MQHLHLRCKHCHREYWYCTYGNGPDYGTEAGCSTEYCAECQKAIDDTLAKIPQKFTWRWKEIEDPRIFEMFELVKKNVKEKEGKSEFPVTLRGLNKLFSGFVNNEEYSHDGRAYLVGWNDDEPEKKHVKIRAEYDLIKKEFTGRAWEEDRDRVDGYSFYRKPRPVISEKIIPVKPMSLPSGNLFWLGFPEIYWDEQQPKPQHILRTYFREYDGKTLVHLIEKKEFLLREVVDVNTIEPILKYDCHIGKYDDEEHEYLMDIKVK